MRIFLTALLLAFSVSLSGQQPPNCAVGGFIISPDGTIWKCNGLGTAASQIATGGAGSPVWGGITGTLSSQTDLQTALDGKQAAGSYATAAQGTKADSALQPAGDGSALTGLTKTQVGLGNVDNTSDASKPISSATQAALDGKQATLVSATNIKTINGTSVLGSGDLVVSGGGGGPSYVVTTQDTINGTTAYADIVGLSFAVSANTRYRVSCLIPYDAASTTNGIGISWTGPASPVLTRGRMGAALSASTLGGTTIVGNDTGSFITGSAATTNNLAVFEGIWSNGANAGTVQMRVRAESAATNAMIVRTGAMCSCAVY